MIKKGLILCILTFLTASLLIFAALYTDELITEFSETEAVETLPVSEIGTYDPNGSDGVYLHFRYVSTADGQTYENAGIYTEDRSIQVGDPVEVVTRDGCPKWILSQTKRGRQRTAFERVIDVGTSEGLLPFILVTLALVLVFAIPNRRMIPAEIRNRKRFAVIITSVYAVSAVITGWFLIAANHESGWGGLGDWVTGVLFGIGGALVLLIAWLTDSVVRKKRQKAKEKLI